MEKRIVSCSHTYLFTYIVTWLCQPRNPLLSFRLGLRTCRLDLAYVEAFCSESLTQIG